MKNNQKVAIVCDWLTGVGGAEKVILAVHQLYPDAPIYTSQYRPKQATWFDDCDVRTGWLNIVPAGLKRFVPFLRQFYFSHLDLSDYALVISVTGAEAKSVRTGNKTVHISYMHAPTQYYWTLYDQYIENPGFGVFNSVARIGLKTLVGPLRKADYKAAQKPDLIIANSSYIQEEIKKHYKRDSEVVWPNVDIETIKKLKNDVIHREGLITFGRQVSWKRIDIVIEAAVRLGRKLTVIGDGPEHTRLVRLAQGRENITFLPRYDGIEEVARYVHMSSAFVFPSLEPFGISAVEALAMGTPVIAFQAGGALDIVTPNSNGMFFKDQTVDSLVAALNTFDTLSFDDLIVKNSADKFSENEFIRKFKKIITEAMKIQ